MSWDVWTEVQRLARADPGLRVLDADEISGLVDRVVAAYVADIAAVWWWDSLRDGIRPEAAEYGDNDPWDLIAELVPHRDNYVLIVTDENPQPAGAITGTLDELARLVRDSPFFEYLITDDQVTFAIFDTHHNTLVSVLPGQS